MELAESDWVLRAEESAARASVDVLRIDPSTGLGLVLVFEPTIRIPDFDAVQRFDDLASLCRWRRHTHSRFLGIPLDDFDLRRHDYLIASALGGLPVPPCTLRGAPTKRNS